MLFSLMDLGSHVNPKQMALLVTALAEAVCGSLLLTGGQVKRFMFFDLYCEARVFFKPEWIQG
jgi:hypothetical protein